MKVTLIAETSGLGVFQGKSIDELIVGQARVSTSREVNELFEEPHKLLRHCILNQHWSIFELANLSFEIETSRAIGREILRHGKQTGLTEFSQRYSGEIQMENVELRYQAISNRQSSTSVVNNGQINAKVIKATQTAFDIYNDLISDGVARECARMVLPETTTTKIYLNFRIRELITFLNARLHKTAQKEIRIIAEQLAEVMKEKCPIISECLFNFEHAYDYHILEQVVLEKYKLRTTIINNI